MKNSARYTFVSELVSYIFVCVYISVGINGSQGSG